MSGETLPDKAARTIALTDMDRSFLVEAGAGSGKTSIMAGRVAVLFARGVEPKNVAAITFTEFAASELRIRIDRFVNDLCTGLIPPDLESAFPKEVPAEQRANLLQAKDALDQLVCATIHGFAQALIKPYPAEAGIDPGAEIIDPAEGELAFAEHYQVWLKEHLSGKGDDDIVAELVLADEAHGLPLIRSIADFLRRNRDARLPVSRAWSSDAGEQFVASAKAFEQEIGRLEFQEDKTHAACQAFIEMAKTLGGFAIGTNRPASRTLIEVAGIPRHLACFTQDAEKRQLKAKGAWENAAAAAGKRRTDGSMAFNACQTRYDACHSAFDTLMAMVAGELLRRVVEAMEGLRLDWTKYKRAAALLDFDDLLYTARDLLAKKEDVRQALAKRFRHVLVDEFQDTDPLQIEILWRLCGEAPTHGNLQPLARVLRAGALFLVGDPKQAIYRFRGADVNAYLGAREAIGGNALLKIVANFRSVEPILAFVNDKFEKPLSSAAGQPGFTALAATCKSEQDAITVAALDIGDRPSADKLRDAEAERIADLCTRLVGNVQVRNRERGVKRACRFGDIALLAPVGTDLWRFEEALEKRGIPVSTQAGKGFFWRQEIQDLIAVTRAIADARDTLAFGALLRGPLVGLTEAEFLDISEGLPADPDDPNRLPQLTLWTQLDHVNHELTRGVLKILQSLAKRARSTTPYMLLSDAASLLGVRAQLRQRFPASADRALANVDLFLETARAYDVRGLRAFARDMRANWEKQVRQVEGRPDAEEQSVSLFTIHASKGLEWPIVIPINMTGTPKSESGLMHDRRSGEFSIPVLDIEPAGYGAIKSWNETELARERVRLWYVAATRARDFLVLPRHAAKLSDKSWARIVDLEVAALPAIDPANLGAEMSPPTAPAENTQTRDLFASEAKRITEAAITIQWHRPSLHEADAPPTESVPVFSDPESVEAAVPVIEIAGSATRGTILHKLMEEVLTGETQDTTAELERRATELLSQLGREPSADPKFGIAPTELAATIVRTLNLPEIAALRPHLAPEYTVFGSAIDGRTEKLISGIADAVARDANDEIEAIIDWKSDVEMNSGKQAKYQTQLGDYRKQTGAKRALLVLMTEGRILNV